MNWNKVAGKLLERAIELRDSAQELGRQNPFLGHQALQTSELLTYLSEALREGANNGE